MHKEKKLGLNRIKSLIKGGYGPFFVGWSFSTTPGPPVGAAPGWRAVRTEEVSERISTTRFFGVSQGPAVCRVSWLFGGSCGFIKLEKTPPTGQPARLLFTESHGSSVEICHTVVSRQEEEPGARSTRRASCEAHHGVAHVHLAQDHLTFLDLDTLEVN